ncbi:MAG: hypothetical protein AAGF12_34400 [Myxococcota bacterium]
MGAKKKIVRTPKGARKQTEVPGTERQIDTEISDAAERLHKVRTARMKLTDKETAAAEDLIEVLERKGVEEYVDEDLELKVTLRKGKDRVSVTKLKDPPARVAPEADAAE